MDIVVILALVVLGFVFLLSLVILIITCQRRRHKRTKSRMLVPFESPPSRFTRPATDNVDEIDSMEQLNALLGELLDKNPWLYEARGIMQHVVAVLSICRSITIKLSGVQLPTTPSPFHDAINMALRNIYPRFDDLIESLATQPIDMRLLEARALSLGTVCWSLYLPYTLLDASFKEVLQKPLNEMNLHLVTVRTAAHLVSVAEKGTEGNLDLVDLKNHLLSLRSQVRGEMLLEDDYETEDDLDDDVIEDDVDEIRNSDDVSNNIATSNDHEKMPLVSSEAIVDMIELTRVVDHKKMMSNGSPDMITNNSHHHHHHHHHHHNVPNGSLNTVEESTEDDHHGEGTSTSCSSSSASSSSSTHPIDPKA